MIAQLDNDCHAHDTVNLIFINGVCLQLQLKNSYEVLFTYKTRNYEDWRIGFHAGFFKIYNVNLPQKF